MCVKGALCVILSFERFKKNPRYSCVGVRSLCVEYAWLCSGHASAVSAYASELVRTAHVPCTSTDAPSSYHAWTAHISRSSRNESACTWIFREACVFGRAPSVIHTSAVRRMFQWFVSDCKWYVRGSCVIHAWFVCDFFPRHPEHLVNFSTHKHKPNLCVISECYLRDWMCDWPLKKWDCFSMRLFFRPLSSFQI